VKVTLRHDGARHRVVIDPHGRLAAGGPYVVTIRGGRTGVKDLAGHALAKTETWSFTVRH
jgi:hypothetical protein